MTWHRSKRIARSSLKWLNWTIVLPTVLLACCLVVLLYTAPGLRFNLWLAENFISGLSVEHSEGSLLGGNRLNNVRYQQNGIVFSVRSTELVVNNTCLLKLSACVDKLILDDLQLEISTSSTDNPPEAASSASAALWLPVPLTIDQFSINNATLTVIGHQLNWHNFSTGIEAWGNKVQLVQPRWHGVELELADTANTASEHATFVYQPPELTDFNLPLSLYVDNFQLTDGLLRQPDIVHKLDTATFSLQWRKQQIKLTQVDVQLEQAQLQADISIDTADDYPLDAALQLAITAGEFAGQKLALTAAGSLSALQLNLQGAGLVQAEIAAELNVLQPHLPHQITFSSAELQWPLITAKPEWQLTGSKLHAQGDLQRSNIDGHFSMRSALAPAAAAEFNGYAQMTGITLDKLLIDTLGGQLSSSISIDWQQQLSWQSQSRLRRIQPSLYWPEYTGELNGELNHNGMLNNDGSWQLDVTQLAISGALRDYALQLSGSVHAQDLTGQGDYRLSTPDLQLQHADNTVSVRGAMQQDWQLSLKLAIPALEQSIATASGSISGEFVVSGQRDKPQLHGNLNAKNLYWQDLSVAQLTLDSRLWLDAKQKLHTELTLNTQDSKYQQQEIQQLNISLSGSEQKHQFSAELKSAEHQASMKIDGALSADRKQWQGTLLQAELQNQLGPWQLQEPATMHASLAEQQIVMAPHCWQHNDSSICLSDTMTASRKQADINVKVHQFNLTTLTALLPLQTTLTGEVDAQLSAHWQQGTLPVATLVVTSDSGSFSRQYDTPLTLAWQQLSLTSQLADDAVQTTMQLRLNEHAELHGEFRVAQLQSGINTLEGQLTLQQFALNFLQPVLGELGELDGQLSSNLSFSGNLQTPQLTGEVELKQVRIKGKVAPVDVDNADLRLNFNGQQAHLAGLITTPEGEVSVNGDASWDELSDWQATVNIKGDELRLQVPQARLLVAPDLTLSATPQLTRLHGNIKIPVATINIDSLPQNAVELSDDLVLLDEKLQPMPLDAKTVFNFQTDVMVVLGNRVKLSAFGLKTLLNGSLRVRQQPRQALRINGDVRLQDGTFRAYGQDLLIRKGKMNFNGPADQPFLNIEAIRNPDNMEDDVIAGIRVTGPADDPNVSIFSEPGKAQANALSYLLMGRDLDSGSGDTGNAVTTGLIGMTLSSSSKVVGEIGEAFGLQELTLDTAGAGDNSQVTVSGYLSRDLQLKYGYGIFNAVGEFTLRYRLMRRLYLEAVSGLDNAVDLLYKFEFD